MKVVTSYLKILGRVVLWSRAPVRAALLVQTDREQQERQQEEETVGNPRLRDGRKGENCVQYSRIQEEESAMSWGTELWVCSSSFRHCVSTHCPPITHRVFMEKWPAERR